MNATTNTDRASQSTVPFTRTARLRGGYNLLDSILVFATAGCVHKDANATTSVETVPSNVNRIAARTGWTAGLGVELPAGDSLNVRTVYLYVDLDNHVLVDTALSISMESGNADFKASAAMHLARVTPNHFMN